MFTALALPLIAEALLSGVESPIGFVGEDVPKDFGGPGLPETSPWADTDEALADFRRRNPITQMGEWPKAEQPATQGQPRMMGAGQQPGIQQARLGSIAPPSRAGYEMPSLGAGTDFNFLLQLRQQKIRNAQRIANQYNRLMEFEISKRREDREGIRQQIFGALRQASANYSQARGQLAQTFATQGQQGLSPLDLGKAAGR